MKLVIFASLLSAFLTFSAAYDDSMSEADFSRFLRSGTMDGFFTHSEFWATMEAMRRANGNSQFLSAPISIGNSFERRSLDGFWITENTARISSYSTQKNIILLTAVHHSREPLSLTMVVLMAREILKQLRSPGHNRMKEVLRDNIIFFMPILNVDSYIYINEHYFGPNAQQIRMIRKNRHNTGHCADWLGGVDLNRNYDMKFGLDEKGSSSDPCSEDYRGARPFSEPETAALKRFVDSHPNIVSNVNMHTYGNAWIYPFNFVHDKSNHLLEHKNKLLFDFYNEFTAEMRKKDLRPLFGNAAFTLDYSTNGEAGDWFTGKKNILNIDVELGNADPRSEEFYPPRDILSDIVRYNWVIMKEFLWRHAIEFSHRVVLFRSQVNFELINNSISSLMNARLFLQPVFAGDVSTSHYEMRYCLKDLMSDACSTVKRFREELSEKVRGRHVLEVQLVFQNAAELGRLEGLRLRIRRQLPFLNYGDQTYYFKRAG